MRSLIFCGGIAGGGLLAGVAAAMFNPGAVSFSRDVLPVLVARCAVCHVTGAEAGALALHRDAAYANLVGVPSIESKWARVKPGAPDQSYLVMKLEGTHLDRGGTGVRMPLGAPPLDEATRQKIRTWIVAGAKNN